MWPGTESTSFPRRWHCATWQWCFEQGVGMPFLLRDTEGNTLCYQCKKEWGRGQWGKTKTSLASVSHLTALHLEANATMFNTLSVPWSKTDLSQNSSRLISQDMYSAEKDNLCQVASVFYNRKEHYHGKTYDRMEPGQATSKEPTSPEVTGHSNLIRREF